MRSDFETAQEFNRQVVAEFRANGGRVSGSLDGSPIMLVHHRGAKSGAARVTPLIYHALDGAHFVVAASNGGAPRHPAWYHNIRASPRIEVEVGTARFAVRAQVLEGTARQAMWEQMARPTSNLRKFQDESQRQVPLVLLTRDVEG